jgi:hypothetical protein
MLVLMTSAFICENIKVVQHKHTEISRLVGSEYT